MTPKRLLLFGIFYILIKSAGAQPTAGYLAVEKYRSFSIPSLLSDLKTAKEDTAKINLLLKLSSKYNWSAVEGALDSSLWYGRQAAALSKSLKYSEGHNEATLLICKSLLRLNDFKGAKQVLEDVYGEQYIRLLLVLSEYYINVKDATPEFLRKAYPYLKAADSLSIKQRSRHWMTESSIAQAKYHFRLGEITPGKNLFLRVIQHHEKIGDKAGQAHWWQELGRFMPDTDSTYAIQVFSYSAAAVLFRELGNKKEEAVCQYLEGYVHSLHNRLDLTEKLYLAALRTMQSAGTKNVANHYQRLSGLYQKQGNLDKALRYALMGLDNLKSLKDSSQLIPIYWTLGNIHSSLGDFSASVKYYKYVLDIYPINGVATYAYIQSLVNAQIKAGNPIEALNFLQSFLKNKNTPHRASDKQLVAVMLGDCYAALKNFKSAEKHYLETIRLNEQVQSSERFWWRRAKSVAGAEANLKIGRFYIERGEFDAADHYVRSALASKNLTPEFEMDGRRMISKVDSVKGDYLASIGHFHRYLAIRDSIGNSTKDKEYSILKANFLTAQKENDIKLLQKEAQLQKRQLELNARTEKFAYIGLASLFCMLGLLYNRYRLKQKKNLQLEEKQKTINSKNSALVRLINEKEWLLKEVHHRVKNNLQIVISLLNSQSVYLKEEAAVNAILESRHRIQAMSMLHQRIYQSENTVGIAMSSYIHELVYYLENSFNLSKRIICTVCVEDIELDLVQAVPVGLILNEAITNSLKYAFPDQREGAINISFKKTLDEKLMLRITDDGIGLAPDFNIKNVKSFGLKLINGLTEDLDGNFTIQGQHGTTILIEFDYKLIMNSLSSRKDLLEVEL